MIETLQTVLRYNPPPINRELFDEWKSHPVTENLFKELVEAYITQFDDTLPEDNIDRGTVLAYKRDGALEMINIFFEWNPQSEEGDDDD